MIVDKDNFYEFIEKFTEVGVIEALDPDVFINAFHSDESSKHKNIVYIWRSENSVPRLKGESDILYIGKTNNTLMARYSESMIKNTEVKTSNNRLKYQHILDHYGKKIKLYVLSLNNIEKFNYPEKKDTLLFLEGQLLRWYFLNHCEYPPLNYTKTTVTKNELEIEWKII